LLDWDVIYPVLSEPDIHKDAVVFIPRNLSICTFEPVSSFPVKVKDLFTLKGDTITSEVINGL
jgi:hypothetical protein